MSGHTPGPWFTEPATCRVPPESAVAISGPRWSELAAVVTHVEGAHGDQSNAEGLANARLIAAAPELAEALDREATAFAWIKHQAESIMALLGDPKATEDDHCMAVSMASDIGVNAHMALDRIEAALSKALSTGEGV